MSDTTPMLMLVKPGRITKADKALARKAGVVVVECEEPGDARLMRAEHEVSHSAMLIAALKAIQAHAEAHPDLTLSRRFTLAVCETLLPPEVIK